MAVMLACITPLWTDSAGNAPVQKQHRFRGLVWRGALELGLNIKLGPGYAVAPGVDLLRRWAVREQGDAEPGAGRPQTLNSLRSRWPEDFVTSVFLDKLIEESRGVDQDVPAMIVARVHKLVRNAAWEEGAFAGGHLPRLPLITAEERPRAAL